MSALNRVTLNIYDLSQGMARQFSPMLLGKTIDMIYHTGVEVFGREFYFGGGICSDYPRQTPYGFPVQTHDMGTTSKTAEQFVVFLNSISHRFNMATYHVLDNNCNNFSNECCAFLVGKSIPQYILDLPKEAMDSPMGAMLRPMIENMSSQIRNASIGHEVKGVAAVSEPAAGSSAPTIAGMTATSARLTLQRKAEDAAVNPVVMTKSNPGVIKKLIEFDPMVSSQATTIENDFALLLESYNRLKEQPEKVFPVLDLFRLFVTHHSDQVSQVVEHVLVDAIQRFAAPSNAKFKASRMMTLRLCVNVVSTGFVLDYPKDCSLDFETLMSHIVDAIGDSFVNIEAGALCHENSALLAQNIAGIPYRKSSNGSSVQLSEDITTRLVACCGERLMGLKYDKEHGPEIEHLLTAMGWLVAHDDHAKLIAETIEINVAKYMTDTIADANVSRLAHMLDVILSA